MTSTEHGSEPDVAGDGTSDVVPDPVDGDADNDTEHRSRPVDPAEITPIDPATADAAGSAPTDGRPPIDPADRAAG